jgi:hypothetical protein
MDHVIPLAESLKGNFVIANLGCYRDGDYHLTPEIQKSSSLIEIDAVAGGETSDAYYKKYSCKRLLSSKPGKQKFRQNIGIYSSSILKPKENLIREYQMEDGFKFQSETEMDAITLPDLLKECGLKHIDFLKTDLEGMDFGVIQSCEAILDRVLAIRCELRPQPFYEGEPKFMGPLQYFDDHGFDMIGMVMQYWKYNTPHRLWQNDGRPSQGDFLFFLRPEQLLKLPPEEVPLACAKQIIIASMVDKKNYAEYLIRIYQSRLPASWIPQLSYLAGPRMPSLKRCYAKLRAFLMPVEHRFRWVYQKDWPQATKMS